MLEDRIVLQRHHMCKLSHLLIFVTSKVQRSVIVYRKCKLNENEYDMRFISSMPWFSCGQEKVVLAKG